MLSGKAGEAQQYGLAFHSFKAWVSFVWPTRHLQYSYSRRDNGGFSERTKQAPTAFAWSQAAGQAVGMAVREQRPEERRLGQLGTIDSVNSCEFSHVQTLLMFADEPLH